jgi:hypothetical protein
MSRRDGINARRARVHFFRGEITATQKALRTLAAGMEISLNSHGYFGESTSQERILAFCETAWAEGRNISVKFPSGEKISKHKQSKEAA